MTKNFERYIKLRRAIQDWLLGYDTSSEIARSLGLTSTSLTELLNWNGLSDLRGKPKPDIDVQDVFNLIFLVYTQSSRKILREKVLRQ